MAREQRREPAAAAAALLGQAHERLLQRDGRARVVAGRCHVAHAVKIRFELRFAAVAHRQQLRAEARGADGEAAVVAALRRDLRREQRALQQQTALHRERAVPRCGVHDLVPEHGRELGFGLSSVSKPRFTAILPPGSAHAFGTELFSTTNSYGSCRSLTAASFWPTSAT